MQIVQSLLRIFCFKFSEIIKILKIVFFTTIIIILNFSCSRTIHLLNETMPTDTVFDTILCHSNDDQLIYNKTIYHTTRSLKSKLSLFGKVFESLVVHAYLLYNLKFSIIEEQHGVFHKRPIETNLVIWCTRKYVVMDFFQSIQQATIRFSKWFQV